MAPTQKKASLQAAVTSSAPQDTVQISTAAQAALQESRETQAQTAKEAAHGDRPAVKLLAKESSSKQFWPSKGITGHCTSGRDTLDGVEDIFHGPASNLS